MVKAIVVRQTGGPDVLHYEDIPVGAPGQPPAIEPGQLAAKGSLFLTRPRLGDYVDNPDELAAGCAELFDLVGRGIVKIDVGNSYGLAQAAHAHSDLESRATTGSTILVV